MHNRLCEYWVTKRGRCYCLCTSRLILLCKQNTDFRPQLSQKSLFSLSVDEALGSAYFLLCGLSSLWPLSSWWQWNRPGMCPPPLPAEQQNCRSSYPAQRHSHILLNKLYFLKPNLVHVQCNVGHLFLLYLPNKQGYLLLCLDINVIIMLTNCHSCVTFVAVNMAFTVDRKWPIWVIFFPYFILKQWLNSSNPGP